MGGSPVRMEHVVMTLIPSVNVAGNRKGLIFGFPVSGKIKMDRQDDMRQEKKKCQKQ